MALTYHPVAPEDSMEQHAHQRDAQFGHCRRIAPGVVAHIDAPGLGGLQINAVKAHALGVDQF
ncbi:hypothetical protein DSECCO2_530780 [anaerobic digester metagenome]